MHTEADGSLPIACLGMSLRLMAMLTYSQMRVDGFG